ncbi:MAG: hypothetical protein CME88_08005 [Hirschia sp.]|nr:hypothetical protein [Hirschia sp.]MBF18302.1 hypothetical protein [Hirschia sp.]
MMLEGKVAIVTGAASGIGLAAAKLFAQEGASVCLADIDVQSGEVAAEDIRKSGGSAIFVTTDVTTQSAVDHMVARTLDAFGQLDIAFNNAGGPVRYAALDECTPEDWDKALALNMTGMWLCMKAEAKAMEASGGGAILNCASRNADAAAPNLFAYTSSKHGVIGMTRSAALDLAPRGIRVNALLPGVTRSPMIEQALNGSGFIASGKLQERIPMGRLAVCAEQAEAACWLLSDRASYVTGTTLMVDGGLSAAM